MALSRKANILDSYLTPLCTLAALYAEAGVEEYWIVLSRERQIEVYRQPGGGTYAERTVIEGDAVLVCGSVPEVRLAARTVRLI